jgi:hypothetical protein
MTRKRIEPAEAAFISLLVVTPYNERTGLLERNSNAIKTQNALDIVESIMHPEITEACWIPAEAYREGVSAFFDKKPSCSNPYPKDSRDYEEWSCGWCDSEGYNEWLKGRNHD